MDTRKLKNLSEEEQEAVRRSENAVSLYVGMVTEIATYRQEGLVDLEKKAMPVFKQMRSKWLNQMTHLDRERMIRDVDSRIGFQPQQSAPSTLFQQPASTAAPVEATEQKDWGCKIL